MNTSEQHKATRISCQLVLFGFVKSVSPKIKHCITQDCRHILYVYLVGVFCCSHPERDFTIIIRYQFSFFELSC